MHPYPTVIFIDAEGEDIKIAKAIDYDKYAPLIVCVEVCGYPQKEIERFVGFMQEMGYVLYTNIRNINDIFVKESMLNRLKECGSRELKF